MISIKKIQSIQLMRFILAFCVVVQHAGQQIINVYYPNKQHFLKGYKLYYIELAVASFIVISGIVMYFSIKNDHTTPKNFIMNRFIRIYPLYFFLTILYFLLYKISGTKNLSMMSLISSLAFTSRQPLLGVAWSLNIEVYFYCLCFLALFINRKKAYKVLLLFLLVIFILELYLLFFPVKMYIPIVYSFVYYKMIIIYFVLGILIGYLYEKNFLLNSKIHIILIVVGIFSGYFLTLPNAQEYWTVYFVVPAFLIIYGCVGIKFSNKYCNFFEYLGNLSYSMYLSHWLSIFLVVKIIERTKFYRLPLHPYIHYFSVLSFTILSSMLLYKYIERPSSTYLKNRLSRFLK